METVTTLKQTYVLVPSHVREAYLFYILTNPPETTVHLRRAPPGIQKKVEEEELEQPPPTIIFCAKARTAAYLTILLKTLGIRSTALHSRLTQRERLNSLSLFRACVVPVLVSTDVGARGLDIEEVGMVINWDVPREAEEYVHRVGRTARAGRGGMAISFVTERDEERVVRIEGRISQVFIPESWMVADVAHRNAAGRNGRARSESAGEAERSVDGETTGPHGADPSLRWLIINKGQELNG